MDSYVEGLIPSFVWDFVKKNTSNIISAGILALIIWNFLRKRTDREGFNEGIKYSKTDSLGAHYFWKVGAEEEWDIVVKNGNVSGKKYLYDGTFDLSDSDKQLVLKKLKDANILERLSALTEKYIGSEEYVLDLKTRKIVNNYSTKKLYRTDWISKGVVPLVTHEVYTGSGFALGTNAERSETELGMKGICNDRICAKCNDKNKTIWFKSPRSFTVLSNDSKEIYRGVVRKCPSCGGEFGDVDTRFKATEDTIKTFDLDKNPVQD